ncbi:hypothetical protein PIROE2DRAFT_1508 [Piromyces sp. E2]|nr:hypothetical protein PIROE2DRAFT_1508 [Piromyces sp. E2]|eukprot:OUM70366.1 hypothetical protein PIROE2DRAFT_1508 [Piromyces sp. E2]
MLKTILVTGGAGFIGSNFLCYFTQKYPKYRVVNLDNLTYAGNLENVRECENRSNYTFVKGDICDRKLIEELFRKYDFHGVIHFASESHVDKSIASPFEFINTNILGTFTLIDVAYHHWMEKPNKVKAGYENCRFHHISTDEIFGTLNFGEGRFKEETQYAPNNPYSSSKASSNFIIRAYSKTFGMNTTTSNCSNNYGPKQHSEKLIPKVIKNCLTGQRIPIHGDGKNIRDWIYVLDHCKAIDLIFHKGKSGEIYNVGGEMKLITSPLPRKDGKKHSEQIIYVQDRPGNDLRYAMDVTKMETELDWRVEESFNSGIVKTIDWYLNKYSASLENNKIPLKKMGWPLFENKIMNTLNKHLWLIELK